jgi:hypothetical protein
MRIGYGAIRESPRLPVSGSYPRRQPKQCVAQSSVFDVPWAFRGHTITQTRYCSCAPRLMIAIDIDILAGGQVVDAYGRYVSAQGGRIKHPGAWKTRTGSVSNWCGCR